MVAALSRPWLVAILSVTVLLYAVDMFRTTRGFDRADFSCLYLWARAARDNLNPYTVDFEPMAARLHLHTDGMDHADYPPTFILLFEPLTSVSPKAAYWLWTGLNAAALAATLLLLLGGDSGLDLRLKVAFAALAIIYYPIRVHFFWGQTQLVLLLMLLLASRWLERGREAAAGLILALAGLLKIFPLFIVGYLVVERRWRALFFTGIGLALGAAATVALFGLPNSLAFGPRLANFAGGRWPAVHGKTDSVELVSLGVFVSRLFAGVTGAHPGSALDWGRPLAVMLAALALVGMTVHATLARPAGRARGRRSFALWIVMAALLSPTAWLHYMVLLLVPYAGLAVAANRGEASRRAIWTGVASYALTQFSPEAFAGLQAILPWSVVLPLAKGWYPCATLLAYGSAYWLTVD